MDTDNPFPGALFQPDFQTFWDRREILKQLLKLQAEQPSKALLTRKALLALCQESLQDRFLLPSEREQIETELARQQQALQALLLERAIAVVDPAEAVLLLQECLAYGGPPPGYAYQLAQRFYQLGESQLALDYVNQALEADPHDSLAHSLQGEIYHYSLEDSPRALMAYERAALSGYPDARLYNMLGHLYYVAGWLPQALGVLDLAGAMDPADFAILCNWLFVARMQPDYEPRALARWTREKVDLFRSAAGLTDLQTYRHEPEPGKRPLRVAYLSSDFYNHATANYVYPLVMHHDPEEVISYCYHSGRNYDFVTARFQEAPTIFRNVAELSDADVAKHMVDDGIDILVEMTGYQNNNSKMLSLLYRPAPVQVAYITHMHTYGLPELDYFFSTEALNPAGDPAEDEAYTEKIFRLPDYCAFERVGVERLPGLKDPPLLQNGFLTMGVFNQPAKYSDQTLRLWAQVMQALPDARLIFCRNGLDTARILSRCTTAGVPVERVSFMPYYLEHYAYVDICLDALPFNAVTTAFDALIMGVPLLTMAGPGLVGRFGSYFNQRVGLSDWNAQTEEEFVALAVQKAAQPERLRELRYSGREMLFASPFYQHRAFVQNLEAAYRTMWEAAVQPKI